MQININVNALDNDDGTYTAAYSLIKSGSYKMEVKLNNKHVVGSPFKQKSKSKVYSTNVKAEKRL